MPVIRVGVIGAGAAGLCAGRNMIYHPDKYDFLIFEQSAEVGGTWNYTEKTGVDDYNLPIHSSMYKNLRTNVPKEIMGFPDYPFPESGKSFTHHTQVLKYLKNYATDHGLYPKIKLLTHVKSVTPEEIGDNKRVWKLVAIDLKTQKESTYEFDAIMVCNGHYAVPNIPPIPDIELYRGGTSHSHSYRDPENFKDRTVIVLGAASSGMDIAMEVSTVAKKVYLSHNLPLIQCELPKNVYQVPGIKRALEDGFVLNDDSTVQADDLMYCTGYLFNFPFLTEKCRVTINRNRVMPLYKHLIHMDYPELCFVGLPFTVLPFPLFQYQSIYFLKTLDKTIELPSREEMEEDAERDFQRRIIDMKMPPKHAHKMGPLQWDYFADLGNEADFETLPPVYRMVYDKVEGERKHNVMMYKKEEYKLLSEQEYARTMPEPGADTSYLISTPATL